MTFHSLTAMEKLNVEVTAFLEDLGNITEISHRIGSREGGGGGSAKTAFVDLMSWSVSLFSCKEKRLAG